MFTKIEGDVAILNSGGVYRQVDLYEMDGSLFAGSGNSFVRLKYDGGTSKPGTRIEKLITERQLYHDRFGRLTITEGEGRTPLGPETTKLIGA